MIQSCGPTATGAPRFAEVSIGEGETGFTDAAADEPPPLPAEQAESNAASKPAAAETAIALVRTERLRIAPVWHRHTVHAPAVTTP
ncbi:MAG: hypothetical protein ACRDSS_13115 [Actinocrinis sp.]